ncbi:FlaD/FlaE family flagellar protein [Haloarchaeobius sp. TZWWS8]|uniref:FlaD/FlaE family flagellar protein n=1 Tax=Haloarchaeobius sp. TZWWS8 TaxID=3446121 RepID=UPI003EBEB867
MTLTTDKPYLASVSRSPAGMAATMQWARYLGETFGINGALNSLRYYEDLGWISDDVRREMIAYIRGLSIAETHHKKYDEPETLDYPLESMSGTPFSTHAQSLEYVSRIAEADLEEHLMLARLAEQQVDNEREDGGRREEALGAIGYD